jgi:hypothetical protein
MDNKYKDFKPLHVYGDWVSGDHNHVREYGLRELHKASDEQIEAIIPARYLRGVTRETKHCIDTLITMIMWKYTPAFTTMARFVQIIDRRLNPRDGWNALTDREVGI